MNDAELTRFVEDMARNDAKRMDTIKNYTSMYDIELAYPNYHINSRDLRSMISDMHLFHNQEMAALEARINDLEGALERRSDWDFTIRKPREDTSSSGSSARPASS